MVVLTGAILVNGIEIHNRKQTKKGTGKDGDRKKLKQIRRKKELYSLGVRQ